MTAKFTRAEVFRTTLAHLQRAINNTPLLMEPFPHIGVRQFFPDHIYEHMLAHMPSAANFSPFSYEKHQSTTGESVRDHFVMSNDSISKLNAADREFWLGIRDALGCKTFKDVVFRKMSPGLAIRFGKSAEEAAHVPGYPLPEIFHETSGYEIKPHPDSRKKLITMQIALPTDESRSHLGTQFYTRSVNPMTMLLAAAGFEIKKTMPFVPNAAYAFCVLNTWTIKSWHGRTLLPNNSGERNTILNIWYTKPEQANMEIYQERYAAAERTAKAA